MACRKRGRLGLDPVCNTSIDDVYSHTPYFDVFIRSYCSMPEEFSNITTQYIISSAGDPYGILIGKKTKLFIVTSVQ